MEKDNYSNKYLFNNSKYSDCSITIRMTDDIPIHILNRIQILPDKTIHTHLLAYIMTTTIF